VSSVLAGTEWRYGATRWPKRDFCFTRIHATPRAGDDAAPQERELRPHQMEQGAGQAVEAPDHQGRAGWERLATGGEARAGVLHPRSHSLVEIANGHASRAQRVALEIALWLCGRHPHIPHQGSHRCPFRSGDQTTLRAQSMINIKIPTGGTVDAGDAAGAPARASCRPNRCFTYPQPFVGEDHVLQMSLEG